MIPKFITTVLTHCKFQRTSGSVQEATLEATKTRKLKSMRYKTGGLRTELLVVGEQREDSCTKLLSETLVFHPALTYSYSLFSSSACLNKTWQVG